jgi:hypothetical protein
MYFFKSSPSLEDIERRKLIGNPMNTRLREKHLSGLACASNGSHG